jgi:peptidoglycan-associated lipoprotein
LYVPRPLYGYPVPPAIYAPRPASILVIPDRAYAYPDAAFSADAYAASPPPRPPSPPPSRPTPAAGLQPIYFDLDQSVIRPDAAETLKKSLEWFKQNPGRKVRIQGNCDPRATGEYNLALGRRRAEATKKYLVGLGVDGTLLETVSYGKGRPSCEAKDESCWEKERRVDFEPVR